MGGVLGLVIGALGVRALLAVNPGDIPRIGLDGAAVTLDWTVMGFTLLRLRPTTASHFAA
jgi:hypothetical protein